MAEVPLQNLARDAPALCAQVVRALESDAELERLAAGGQGGASERSTEHSGLAALAGAPDAGAAVADVEALRGILWEALLEALRRDASGWAPASFDSASARLLADLSDRLAYVCATVLAAMLTNAPAASERPPPASYGRGEAAPYTPMPASRGSRTAILIDELADAIPAHDAGRPRYAGQTTGRSARGAEGRAQPVADTHESRRGAGRAPGERRPRPLPWDSTPRGGRPGGRAPETGSAPQAPAERRSSGDGGEPVLRVSRGSSALTDERS
jgi:hypothetical protein